MELSLLQALVLILIIFLLASCIFAYILFWLLGGGKSKVGKGYGDGVNDDSNYGVYANV